MGVGGLLRLLKSVSIPTNLSHLKGCTVGIDGYAWLHRSAVLCAKELALGQPTVKYVDYFEKKIHQLRSMQVEPYFVFDGDRLPTKANVERDRGATRQAAKQKGMLLYSQGRTRDAYDQFQKCVDITPSMAATVIELLKRYGVRYVVAPYEADAQLVYLEKQNHIHAIISEDSDLLVFGAKRLLTKMDPHGSFIEISRDRFKHCTDLPFGNFSDADLRTMAILQGCDYSPGLVGIGPQKAHALVRKYRNYNKIVKVLRLQGSIKVPHNFDQVYEQADLTFLHQRVFCPESNKVVMLNPLDANRKISLPNFHEFIGKEKDPKLSVAIARGLVDPMTAQKISILDLPLAVRANSSPTPIYSTPSTARKTIKSYFSVASSTPVSRPALQPISPPKTTSAMKRRLEKFLGSSDDEIDESFTSNYFSSNAQTPQKLAKTSSSPASLTSHDFNVADIKSTDVKSIPLRTLNSNTLRSSATPVSLEKPVFVAQTSDTPVRSMSNFGPDENLSSPETSPQKSSKLSIDRLAKFACTSSTSLVARRVYKPETGSILAHKLNSSLKNFMPSTSTNMR